MKLIKKIGAYPSVDNSLCIQDYAIYECKCGVYFTAPSNKINKKNLKCKNMHPRAGKIYLWNKINKIYRVERKYAIWGGMKSRCYNINNVGFKDYGARGVSICKEWLKDFTNFEKWALSNGYKANLSIDRIDPYGNYEPSNCRWTTRAVQARNTRKLSRVNTSGYRGISFSKRSKKWKTTISVNRKIIHLGYHKCRLAAAYAYDNFVIDNNLEHTRNF